MKGVEISNKSIFKIGLMEMSSQNRQECPLCDEIIEFKLIDAGNMKKISCKECAEFIVSLQAEKILKKSSSEWKSQLASKTKQTPNEYIYVITKSSDKQNLNLSIVGSWKKRSEFNCK